MSPQELLLPPPPKKNQSIGEELLPPPPKKKGKDGLSDKPTALDNGLSSTPKAEKQPSIKELVQAPNIPSYAQGGSQSVSTQVVQPKITATYDDFKLHNAERKEKKAKLVDEAIRNTARKYLKNKGVIVPNEEGKALNISEFMQLSKEEKRLREAYDNGDATFAISDKGEVGLKKTSGWWESLKHGWNESMKANDEAAEFSNNMDAAQKVQFLKQKQAEAEKQRPDGYLGERGSALGSIGGLIGENAPFLIKAGEGAALGAGLIAAAPETLGASLTGLPAAMGFLFTAEDSKNQGVMAEVTRRFEILKQENPNADEVTLMQQAEQGALSGGLAGIATNAALMTGIKTPLSLSSKKVVSKAITKAVGTTVYGAGATAGIEGLKSAEGNLEGIKSTPSEIAKDMGRVFGETATTLGMLHVITGAATGAFRLPKMVRSAIKYSLVKDGKVQELTTTLKANEEAGKIPEGTTDKVMGELGEYKAALDKTMDGLSPEAEAAVAGLIEAKTKLIEEQKTKDDSEGTKAYYKEKIDGINSQIDKINNTGKPYAHEIDEISGNTYKSEVPKEKGEPEQISQPIELSTEVPKEESGIVTLPPESFPEPVTIGEKVETKTENNGATSKPVIEPVPTGAEQQAGQAHESGVRSNVNENSGNAADGTATVSGNGKLPPNETVNIPVGDGKEMIGMTHAEFGKIAEEVGVEGYDKNPQSVKQWHEQSDKKIADGELPELLERLKGGDRKISVTEQFMLGKYVAGLKHEWNKTKSDAVLDEIQKVMDYSNVARAEAARVLRGGQEMLPVHPLDTEGAASAMIAKMDANKTDVLTDQQKAEVESQVAEYKKAAEDANLKIQEMERLHQEQLAQAELDRMKDEGKKKTKSKGKTEKKSHDDYVAERKTLKEQLKEAKDKHDKWLKDNGIQTNSFGGGKFVLTNDMAKVIAKIIKSHFDEGVHVLADLIKKAVDEAKDVLPDITDRDIRDVLVGKYNEKKDTRNELQAKWVDIQQEQKLLDEYDRVSRREPKTEKEKRDKNEILTALRKKIDAKKLEETLAEKHENKVKELEAELERVRLRKSKEPIEKGATKEKVVSEEEQQLIDKINEEQAAWNDEKDNARKISKEYQSLETERNRQLKRVPDLKEKLGVLQSGKLPETKTNTPKVDTPEIEALKRDIEVAEKSVRESIAHEKKMREYEKELDRLENRRKKDTKEISHKEISDEEKAIREKILEERKLWAFENSIDNRINNAEKELQRLKDRKEKEVNPDAKKELSQREKDLQIEIDAEKAWAQEKKMDDLEADLQRIKDRSEKAKKPESKRVVSDEEKLKRAEIEAEQNAWDIEKNIEKLNQELQRIKDRKQKATTPKSRRALTDLENNIVKQIKDEKQAWAKEVEPERKLRQALDNAQKSLDEYERRINEKDTAPKGTQPVKETPELKVLRDKVKEAKERYNKVRNETGAASAQKLKNMVASNDRAAAKLLQRIADEDFAPEKPKSFFENFELKQQHPELYNDVINAIHRKEEARHKFDIALLKDKKAKEDNVTKALDIFKKTVNTSQQSVAGFDDSMMFVQLGSIIAKELAFRGGGVALNFKKYTDANGKTKIKMGGAIKEHVLDAWSEARFNKQMTALHNSLDWPLMKASGLDVLEPKSLLARMHEDMFQNSYLEHIGLGTIPMGSKLSLEGKKVAGIDPKRVNLGKFAKIWERAYTSLGNNVRVDLFRRAAKQMYKDGMTIENNLDEFKGLAKAINNLTGRGTTTPGMAKIVPYTTLAIWSPKMMASTINLLGLSDLGSAGKHGFYSKLPPEARKYAAKQMAEQIGVGVAIMAAAAVGGATVYSNPFNDRFGDIQYGDDDEKSFNVWGRFAGYFRLAMKLIAKPLVSGSQKAYTSVSGNEIDEKYKPENVYEQGGKTSAGLVGKFVRGKFNPLAGVAYDLAANDQKGSFDHKPLTPSTIATNLTVPMSMRNVKTMIERDGTMSLLTHSLPAFLGVSMKDARDYNDTGFSTEVAGFMRKKKLKINPPSKDKDLSEEEYADFVKRRNERLEAYLKQLKEKGLEDGATDDESYQNAADDLETRANAMAKDEVLGIKPKEQKKPKRVKNFEETIEFKRKEQW